MPDYTHSLPGPNDLVGRFLVLKSFAERRTVQSVVIPILRLLSMILLIVPESSGGRRSVPSLGAPSRSRNLI